MGQTINFDAVVVETTDIIKGGRTFALRDDVPMRTLARGFKLLEMDQQFKDVHGYSDMETIYAEEECEILDLCHAIFAHSYPAMSHAEVAELLTPNERAQLTMAFFMSRLAQSLKEQRAQPQPQTRPLEAEAPDGISSATTTPTADTATSPTGSARRSPTFQSQFQRQPQAHQPRQARRNRPRSPLAPMSGALAR